MGKYGTHKVSGIPVPGVIMARGDTHFVHSGTGTDTADNGAKMNLPYATLDYAIGRMSAGDVVYLLPGHSETTGSTTIDVSDISVIGLGSGLQRPTLTTATATDIVSITGDNVLFQGFHFGPPGIDAVTSMINITGAGVTVKGISGVGSTTAMNVVDCITVGAATADDLWIEDVFLTNSTVAVNSFLSFEAAASRVTVKNFRAFGDVATAGVIDSAKVDYLVLEDVTVCVVGTTKPAATLDSNPEGMAIRCNWGGTHGTLATNAALGNLMRIFDNRILEETDGSVQGAVGPVADTE